MQELVPMFAEHALVKDGIPVRAQGRFPVVNLIIDRGFPLFLMGNKSFDLHRTYAIRKDNAVLIGKVTNGDAVWRCALCRVRKALEESDFVKSLYKRHLSKSSHDGCLVLCAC